MLPVPLPLRAHQVLCLQGFRGRGYSDAFTDRMQEVSDALAADPDRPVRLGAGPDVLCAACPHLDPAQGCTLKGPGHEAHMRAQDEAVLARLGLEAEVVLPWREILLRIGAAVRGDDLPAICTTCPWLPLGWCAEGVDRLSAPRDP